MITEQQILNITAFLEMARTAIDDAELKMVALLGEKIPSAALVKAKAQIHAAVDTLHSAEEWIKQYEYETGRVSKDGATANGVSTGNALVP